MTNAAKGGLPRLTARMWIDRLADGGSFREMDSLMRSADRLGFYRYEDKLKEAVHNSGENEAVVTGYASVGGYPCVLAVMEPRFMALLNPPRNGGSRSFPCLPPEGHACRRAFFP